MKNRDDIVRHLTAKFGSEHRLTNAMVIETFDYIKQTLIDGEIVRITHFGMFQAVQRQPHLIMGYSGGGFTSYQTTSLRNVIKFRPFRTLNDLAN